MTPEERYRYQKEWELDRLRGIERMVDVRPVREHIDALIAQGATYALIGGAIGVDRHTVGGIRDRNEAVVTRGLAEKILELDERVILSSDLPDRTLVPKLGAERRVKALLRMGYSHNFQRAHSGVSTRSVVRPVGSKIILGQHRAVARMFAELCMTPGPSPVAARNARSHGYFAPLDYDDIDDPNEFPQFRQEAS